jgi:uncharacterized protein with FMN-binding domain
MASKMPRHLVALSSSAIAAIYFAGFVATRSADAGISADPPSAADPATQVAAPSPSTASQPTPLVSASTPRRGNRGSLSGPGSGTTATATPTTPTAPPAASSGAPAQTQASTYKDGTYTGSGTSRRGGVDVQLTIQDSRITNVTITRVTTQYPVSRIASLPAEVIARQSAQVDRISGATYSVQAFQQAVQQALSSARA